MKILINKMHNIKKRIFTNVLGMKLNKVLWNGGCGLDVYDRKQVRNIKNF